jgi:hypothetical protein
VRLQETQTITTDPRIKTGVCRLNCCLTTCADPLAEDALAREGRPRLWNDRGFWILLLLPLVLLALNNRWAVTPPGAFDPWAYFGQYRNLWQHLSLFGCTYNAGRLSVILPGYVAHQLLPVVAANYALRLSLFYASILSLYVILSWTLSRRVALLAAACLGCQFFFLTAIGWNYVDGFGVAYFCLAALALTAAARSPRWRIHLAAAGASAAALVLANPVYIILVPSLAVHYAFFNRQSRRNSLRASMALFALGGIGLLLALSVFSWLAAGRFWFLVPTWRYMTQNAGGDGPRLVAVSSWLPHADWVVLAVLTLLGSAGFLWRNRRCLGDRRAECLYLFQFIALLALFMACQLRGLAIVQFTFYFSVTLPATVLAFAAVLAPYVEDIRPRTFSAVAGTVLIVLLVPHALNGTGDWLAALSPWSGALLVGAGTLGLIAAWAAGTKAWITPVLVLLFIALPTYVAGAIFVPDQDALATANGRHISWERLPRTDVLRAVAASVEVIRQLDHTGQGRFWYDARASMGEVFRDVCASYFWAYRLVNERFPAVHDRAAFTALKRQRVWILSAEPEALAQAQTALNKLGLEARLIAQQVIKRSSVNFTMYYVTIEPRDVRAEAQAIRVYPGGGKGSLISAESDGVPSDSLPLPQGLWHLCGPPETASWKRFFRCRGSLSVTAEGLDVTTAEGCYALAYAPLTAEQEGDYRFEVTYSPRTGLIGLGILNEDQSGWLVQSPGEAPLPPQKPDVLIASCTVHLKAGATCQPILTNNRFDGAASRAVLRELRMFREIPRGTIPQGRR